MVVDDGYAYAETLEVLKNMDKVYINKIPDRLMELLKNNSSKTYKEHINSSTRLKEQNLSSKTLKILAVINLKYWIQDESKKLQLLKEYKANDKLYEGKLRKKYDIDVFKNRKIDNMSKREEVQLVEYKDSKLKRILTKIINLIKGGNDYDA